MHESNFLLEHADVITNGTGMKVTKWTLDFDMSHKFCFEKCRQEFRKQQE